MNTENNKLIAEFLGYNTKSHWWNNGDGGFLQDTDCKFHSSWDWLMPVVEMIQACEILTMQGFNVIIYNRVTEIKCRWSGKLIALMQDNTKIESVYSAVVEFITWYNKQQPKK